MDATQYRSSEFGEVRLEHGNGKKGTYSYFLPTELPRVIELDSETVLALSEADSALGYLQGLGKLIRDPDLLIGPFLTREAVASSRIEGTRASLSEVLKAGGEVEEERTADVNEVVQYVQASRRGLELIESLPITQRLIREVHKVLLSGVRGTERQPGELRKSPVWIGAGAHTLETANYVAPAPEHVGPLLSDWERFVNEPSRIPILVRCALMHYQFETIHPFLDGNGRIGRLLVGLMLINEGKLTSPLLYLSGYLETHRSEYYERLQAVRERGEMRDWIRFFLRAVREQADDAVSRAGRLVDLREQYLDRAKSDPSRISAIVPIIFRNPYISVPTVSRAVGVSGQGARNLLRKAEQYGWITKIGQAGRGGKTIWVANDIFSIIDEPVVYHAHD